MNLGDYLSSDATTLARLVSEKEVTAVELLALARQRCDAVNPTINAVVAPLAEVADAQAVDPGLSGSFAGVPFLVRISARSTPASRPPTAPGLGRRRRRMPRPGDATLP